jgi:ABC-type transport system substrate-binding protein
MNRVILAIMGVMAALVVGVGVMVVVLVASGGDDGDSQVGSEPTEENGNGGDDGRAEGELRLRGGEPITLDPHITQDAASALYVVEIFGGLLTLDTELQLQPDLAEEIPTEENGGKVVNEDGTVTYTFRLREDALFHDRKPVTAETVKFSLERAADPATQSLVAEFFLGDIVGVAEKLRGDADEISGVRVVDGYTVEITIDRDLPSFLFKLTYPTAFVVDPTQVDSDSNWTRHPNGTGPYKLDQWRLGERIVLKANEHYHLFVRSGRLGRSRRRPRRPTAHPRPGGPAEQGVPQRQSPGTRLHRFQHSGAAVRRSPGAAGLRNGYRQGTDRQGHLPGRHSGGQQHHHARHGRLQRGSPGPPVRS